MCARVCMFCKVYVCVHAGVKVGVGACLCECRGVCVCIREAGVYVVCVFLCEHSTRRRMIFMLLRYSDGSRLILVAIASMLKPIM